MTEQEKTGFFHFTVEPFTDDVTGHLSWHTLGKQLLTCAGYHADSHGFGFKSMSAEHRAWVLSRLVMECESMPHTLEEYHIETFVNKVYRQFTDRMFILHGADGESIHGYGFSTWALIDYESRVPVNLDELPNGGFRAVLTERTLPITGPGRIRVKSQEAVAQHTVAFTDLDVNGHMNSIRYIDLLMDLAVTSVKGGVRRIDIAFGREAMLGDTLLIYRDGNQFEIRQEDGTVLVRAEIQVLAE